MGASGHAPEDWLRKAEKLAYAVIYGAEEIAACWLDVPVSAAMSCCVNMLWKQVTRAAFHCALSWMRAQALHSLFAYVMQSLTSF